MQLAQKINITYRAISPFVFNGKDFIKDPGSLTRTELTSLCYSGNGFFEYTELDSGEPFLYT